MKENFAVVRGFFDAEKGETGLGSVFFVKDAITAELFDARNNSYQVSAAAPSTFRWD